MRLMLLTATMLACAACQPKAVDPAKPVDTAAETSAIEAIEQAQVAAVSAKDPAKSTELYASDARFIGDDGKLISGKDAIAAAFKSFLNDPALKFEYQPGAKTFSADGTMAYSTAPFTETLTDHVSKKVKTISGTNLSVWQKQADGGWKLVADSNPAAPTG